MESNKMKRGAANNCTDMSETKVAKTVLDDTVLYADVLTQNLATQVEDVMPDQVSLNEAILMVISYFIGVTDMIIAV
jgi:hypothetical protein